jgi:sigma-B regulation protein RsbU (phosphoserine phosphatase)
MVQILDHASIPGQAPRLMEDRLVLIADDSQIQRLTLARLLMQWGYSVIQASDGEEALALATSARPDIILSDWVMPRLTGPEFCAALRDASPNDYAYFILLTSKSDKQDVATGLNSGADDLLTKPVDGNELLARLGAGERIIDMQHRLAETNKVIAATLKELRQVHQQLDRDLQEARDFQQSLMQERFRRFDGASLSLLMRSSDHVGGDLTGYYPIGQRYVGLFGADVSGHGISSALMTARLAGYISAADPDHNIALSRDADGRVGPRPPQEVVAALNALVLEEMDTAHYLTLMLGLADLKTGEVRLSQAGHPNVAVQRRSGEISFHGTGGFPVGLLRNAGYEAFSVRLHPGDRLFIFSDGVTECPDPDGTLLGDDGLRAILDALADMKGPHLLDPLIGWLSGYAGTDSFPDDLSVLVFEYEGSGAQP